MFRCRPLVCTLQRNISRTDSNCHYETNPSIYHSTFRTFHCVSLRRQPASVTFHWKKLVPHQLTSCKHSSSSSTPSTSTSSSTSEVTLYKRLKRYGIAFLITDCSTWFLSLSTFFLLFSAGVQMDTLVSAAEHVCDVRYYAGLFNINLADLTGDKAALSLSAIACTITFPIRLYVDFVVLFVLTRMGVICPPKESPVTDKES